jgi:hypothetical protein
LTDYISGTRTEAEGFAALERLAAVGGEPAVGTILGIGNGIFDRANSAGATEVDKERNVAFGKFATRMAPTLFPKMQNLNYYKGASRAAGGIKAEELVSMAAPSVEMMIKNLNDTLASTTATAKAKTEAREGLDNLALAFQMAATSEETNRRIGPGLRREFQKAVASGSLSGQAASQVQQGLNYMLGQPSVPSPGELRVQHEENITRTLPPDTIVTPGTPDREAFKIQLRTNPQAFDTLVNGIASGAVTTGSTYFDVLNEMKSEAVAASTPEAIADWNQKVGQLQQAYQQHLDQEVASAVAAGVDPATARTVASSVAHPATGKTLLEEITSLEATPPTGVAPNPIGKI